MIDDLKEILSDLHDGVENVGGQNNRLLRQISFLEALVKQDPELSRKYEAAKKNIDRGMGGGGVLKPGLKVRIQSLGTKQ